MNDYSDSRAERLVNRGDSNGSGMYAPTQYTIILLKNCAREYQFRLGLLAGYEATPNSITLGDY